MGRILIFSQLYFADFLYNLRSLYTSDILVGGISWLQL